MSRDRANSKGSLAKTKVGIVWNYNHASVAALAGHKYLIDGDTQIAIKHLNSADAIWKTAGEGISAGFRRIILFRRFMGQVSFFSAIKKFAGNSDMSI